MRKVPVWLVFIVIIALFASCMDSKQSTAQSPDISATLSPKCSSIQSPAPSSTQSSDASSTQSPDPSSGEPENTESALPPTPAPKPITLSAWVTYWDMEDVMTEACELGESLGALSFFAAYFDADGKLFVREEVSILLEESKDTLSEKPLTRYITVVNDKLNNKGPASLKDVSLLYSLLGSGDAINTHIEDLIALAETNGYDGLEIDYEGIHSDLTLWNYFITFLNRLNTRTCEAGLKLRVLLEPSTPFDRIVLPAGPEYVMMCYNLYGNHSGPGPKADARFIRQLMDKMSGLTGEKTFAIATGGFDWGSSGSIDSITEAQATALMDEYSAQLYRDEASMCAVFKYTDEHNDRHEVWYADSITLRYWMDIIQECGYSSIALWRLGSNDSIDDLLTE